MRNNHSRRAANHGRTLAWSLAELREHVERGIRHGCPYCGCQLNGAMFHGDHAMPISRGGSFDLDNLAICCKDCNDLKGPLTGAEFLGLLALVSEWPDEARRNLLTRLRAAGGRYRRR